MWGLARLPKNPLGSIALATAFLPPTQHAPGPLGEQGRAEGLGSRDSSVARSGLRSMMINEVGNVPQGAEVPTALGVKELEAVA